MQADESWAWCAFRQVASRPPPGLTALQSLSTSSRHDCSASFGLACLPSRRRSPPGALLLGRPAVPALLFSAAVALVVIVAVLAVRVVVLAVAVIVVLAVAVVVLVVAAVLLAAIAVAAVLAAVVPALAAFALLAQRHALRLALGGHLRLVRLETGEDAAAAGLDASAQLLRVGPAGMVAGQDGALGKQGDDQGNHHGFILASERMLSLMLGSWGTEAISRLSARPMPGICAPASRRGGAESS